MRRYLPRDRFASAMLLLLLTAGAYALSAQSLPPPPAQSERARLLAVTDAVAAEAMKTGSFAGLSIAVSRGPEVLVARGYGFADLEHDVPAMPDTVYRIASVSKQFGAVAILQLVEAGKMRLDDDITKHFPGWPTGGKRITVEHLLHHTSGVKDYTSLSGCTVTVKGSPTACRGSFRRLDLTTDEMLAVFRDEPKDFEPGEKYRYSNSGYFMLGAIVERVSGLSFGEYVERNFFGPLGMTRSSLCHYEPVIKGRARGYTVQNGRFRNSEFMTLYTPGAAGSICSSVSDLIVWTRALHSGKLVGADHYRRMITPGRLNDGSATKYGYALDLGDLDDRRFIGHTGSISGFRAHLTYYPDADVIVSILTNTESRLAEIEKAIARAALGRPASTQQEREARR